jgi:AcrR family transcriptional regulator
MKKTRRSPARPVDTRTADTRRRLIETGLELFGRNGLEGVTTRDLAKAAGVNLAAIPYHFGSKDGVYLAVAEFIAEHFGGEIRDLVAPMQAAVADPKTPRKVFLDLLVGYMTGVVLRLGTSPIRPLAAMFVVREQMQPSAAFDTLYKGLMSPALGVIDRLVAGLMKLPADDPRVVIEVHMLWGELFSQFTTREALLRRMGWKQLGEAELKLIAGVMEDLVRRQFAA